MEALGYLTNNLFTNRHLVSILICFICLAYLVLRRAKDQSFDPDEIWMILLWSAIGAILVGRLFHIMPHAENYIKNPLSILHINYGLHLYGGLLGGIIGGFFATRKTKIPLESVMMLFTPFIFLSISLNRFACVVDPSTCLGKIAGPPIGISLAGGTQPRIPSHLIEGFFLLVLVTILFFLERRYSHKPYVLFFIGIAGYGLIRSIIDMTRTGWPSLWIGIDTAIGILLIILSIIFIRIYPHIRQPAQAPNSNRNQNIRSSKKRRGRRR
jgi:prolipoprotein diacylglyceryltransferase